MLNGWASGGRPVQAWSLGVWQERTNLPEKREPQARGDAGLRAAWGATPPFTRRRASVEHILNEAVYQRRERETNSMT